MRKNKYLNDKGKKLYSYTPDEGIYLKIIKIFVILGGILFFLMFLSYIHLGDIFRGGASFLIFIFVLLILIHSHIVDKYDDKEVYEHGLWALYPYPTFLPDEPEKYFRSFDEIISIEGIPSDETTDNMVEIITEDEEISVPIPEDDKWNEFVKVANEALERYEKEDN